MILGFPSALARQLPTQDYLVISARHLEERLAPEENHRYLQNFSPDTGFLLRYDGLGAEIDPRGFSGGGAWHRLPTGEGIWQPNLRLGGLCVGHYSGSRLLHCLKIESVIQALEDLDWPTP